MVYGFLKKARYKRSMCPPLPPTVQPVVYNFVDARKDDKTNSAYRNYLPLFSRIDGVSFQGRSCVLYIFQIICVYPPPSPPPPACLT